MKKSRADFAVVLGLLMGIIGLGTGPRPAYAISRNSLGPIKRKLASKHQSFSRNHLSRRGQVMTAAIFSLLAAVPELQRHLANISFNPEIKGQIGRLLNSSLSDADKQLLVHDLLKKVDVTQIHTLVNQSLSPENLAILKQEAFRIVSEHNVNVNEGIFAGVVGTSLAFAVIFGLIYGLPPLLKLKENGWHFSGGSKTEPGESKP